MLTWPLTAIVWFHQLTLWRTKEAGAAWTSHSHSYPPVLLLGFKHFLHITEGSLETTGNSINNPADPQHLFPCSKKLGSKYFPVFLVTLTGSLPLFSLLKLRIKAIL